MCTLIQVLRIRVETCLHLYSKYFEYRVDMSPSNSSTSNMMETCALYSYFEYNGDMCTLIQYSNIMETCASIFEVLRIRVHMSPFNIRIRWRHVHSNSSTSN